MIHYYTNREISEKLDVNLARWKRWSRSFLPPDPLGGMQSGYARQYVFKDLLKVVLGGYMLSHLKLSVAESQQVLADLSPWLKKKGFFDLNGRAGADMERGAQSSPYRIYFCSSAPVGPKCGSGFHYLIRKIVRVQIHLIANSRQLTETIEETLLHCDLPDGRAFLQQPHIHMINLTALLAELVGRLSPRRR